MASNKEKKAKEPKQPKRASAEKYEIIEIHRTQINNAPYNPRQISDKAKNLLRKNLATVGLLSPIVWNRRTGNIVSGHQRIDAMDKIERTHDYMLRVSAVDLDEKTEKEQNVFMNNPEAQGVFNESLTDLLKDVDLNIEAMGFSEADVFNLLGENLNEGQIEQMAEMSNRLQESVKAFEAAASSSNARNETEFYLVVVFRNNKSRADFCNRHGFEDFRYLDGRELDQSLSRSKLPEANGGEI
jgi:hypothetical protein